METALQFLVTTLILGSLLAGCASSGGATSGEKTAEWDAAKRADVHAQLAAGYLQRDQIETAREELEVALEIQPDHSRANYVMAILQTRMGKADLAERYYVRALKADRENSEAAHDYGVFLCQLGRVDDAIDRFQQALSNPLYRGRALTNLRAGECLMTQGGRHAQAEPYFRAALKANPRLAPALYQMAEIHYDGKQFLPARGFIERFFAVSEPTAKSLLLAYRIETELGAPDVARDYAKRLKKEFAASDEAREVVNVR